MASNNIYKIHPKFGGSNTTQGLSSMNTISLGNITLGGITNDFFNNQFVKKYEIIDSVEDLLVLSCAWHRIRKTNQPTRPSIISLVSQELFQSITQEDRDLAAEVRDYYSKKLMVLVLKEQRLTPFRQDLNIFLHNDPKKFTENFMPLVYRLPEFYEYDKKFDEMKPQFETKMPPGYKTLSVKLCKLSSVHKIRKHNKNTKVTEYWFKGDDNYAYKFSIDPVNMLTPIWDREFESGLVTGTFNTFLDSRDGFPFYAIKNIVQI